MTDGDSSYCFNGCSARCPVTLETIYAVHGSGWRSCEFKHGVGGSLAAAGRARRGL